MHRPSGVEVLRTRIELSPAGLRAVRAQDGPALEILQDFTASRLWFVNRDRAIAHELTFDGESGGVGAGENGDGVGFVGQDACAGEARRDEGSGRWRGRGVRAVACLGARGQVQAIELVDERHGIVILRQTPDGLSDELRDIRPRRFSSDHFQPPSRFRSVSARELLHGIPALGRYREPGREISAAILENAPAVP